MSNMSAFQDVFLNVGVDEEGDFMPIFPVEGEDEENQLEELDVPEDLPIVALRNTVLFPNIIIPITVSRDKSIEAIQKAHSEDKLIAVFSQRSEKIEDPGIEDLYHIGVMAKIIKLLKMPDGSNTAILQGKQRVALHQITQRDPFLAGKFSKVLHVQPQDKLKFEALISSIRDSAKKIIDLNPNIPSEASVMLKNIPSDTFLLHFISSNLGIDIEKKQAILEIDDLYDKAESILSHMDSELQLLELKDQIESKVRVDIEKQQRDYFLNQQLKTIQDELGSNPQEAQVLEFEKRAKDKKWPESVAEIFNKDLGRLRRTNPQTPDFSVLINYLEILLDLPWGEFSKDNFNLKRAQKVLDSHHHGLDKVKDRIIEHLAVLKLKKNMKAPILCLVGPPGVGKTSLGKSIAEALDREYIRMSLGGLHDESEIRGHRKTYIGAMPGRIIKSLKKAGTSNPVFILDEIDKIGKDFRGDPSSALLEVLDPEQNENFYDNFLELEYDLSNILFIATANSLNTIQPALRDRMEIIQVHGYSVEEKIDIAKKHLIPKQLEEHGLKKNQVKLKKGILKQVIEGYTRESGVRSLNRKIAGLMRSVATRVAKEEAYNTDVTSEEVKDYLGPKVFSNDKYSKQQPAGVAVGLAWTSVGGDILFIEVSLSKGKGKLTLTGNLGDVMKESATSALSYIKAHAEQLGIEESVFTEKDIHIHVPEGAIPKDGPSAGITMLSALTSAFTGRPLTPYTAMTGEITLRGRVLPVGGIKEKVLAAKRAGLKRILLCEDNRKDIEQINEKYLTGLTFEFVEDMKKVVDLALV